MTKAINDKFFLVPLELKSKLRNAVPYLAARLVSEPTTDNATVLNTAVLLSAEADTLIQNIMAFTDFVREEKITAEQIRLTNEIVELNETALSTSRLDDGKVVVTTNGAKMERLLAAIAELNKAIVGNARKSKFWAAAKATAVVTGLAAATAGAVYYFKKKADEQSGDAS